MRSAKKMAAAILAAVSLMLGMDAIALKEAAATPACAEELHLAQPTSEAAAEETPALLVHGLGSKAGTWSEGEPSMKGVVDQIEDVRAVTFDYKKANDRWVTNPAIGQKLAKTIVCYSKLYDGKNVILIAHSMGGLASEEALSWAAYGTFAKDVTGHIVTIGTPYEGSLLANAEFSFWMGVCNAQIGIFSLVEDTDELCRQSMSDKATAGLSVNAEQAAKLPKFPEGISVKAIAGDVRGRTCVVWGCSEWRSTGGDLVVPIKSATAHYTTTGRGDGKKVFSCNTEHPILKLTDAWCEHSNMLQAPQVQEEVRRSIQEYLASLKPTGKRVETFNGLTLRLFEGTELHVAHGEGPTSYELKCGGGLEEPDCPDFSVYNPREVRGGLGWPEWEWDGCGATKPVKPVEAGTVRIGGKPATRYLIGHCRVWLMKGNSAFIIAGDPPGELATAADAIIASAVWGKPTN